MRSHVDPDATEGCQPGSPQWHQIHSMELFLADHMRAENCNGYKVLYGIERLLIHMLSNTWNTLNTARYSTAAVMTRLSLCSGILHDLGGSPQQPRPNMS